MGQVEHEKQTYALMGQNDAAQAIYNRMHQRTAQEQGEPSPFMPCHCAVLTKR